MDTITHYERNVPENFHDVDDLMAALRATSPDRSMAVFHAHTHRVAGDFDTFVRDPLVARVMALLSSLVPTAFGELTTQANVFWQLANYRRHGRRTFVVAEPLARRLLATELRGLRCADLRLPYPSLYVVVDEALGFRVRNPDTGWHRLTGVYLTQDAGNWRLLLCARAHDGAPEWDDALSCFDVELDDGQKPVDDTLAKLRAQVLAQDSWRQAANGILEPEAIVDEWTAIFKWLMNLVMFITHADAADLEHVEANAEARGLWSRMQRLPTKSAKREKLKARWRQCPRRPRIVVGARVVADPRWPRTVGDARALLVRSLVAGHWQRYHVGPGRGVTEWKFREPFWRGPEAGGEGPRVHEVR